MKILAIDTSSRFLSLGIFEDQRLLAGRTKESRGVLSESIIPEIESLFKKSKLKISMLDGIAVGLGPGSFTSLRVGLSTAKGLCFSEQKSVVGILSFDAVALSSPVMDGTVCVISDARRGLLYSCLYRKSGDKIIKKRECRLDEPKNVLKGLKGKVFFTGDGVELYREFFRSSLPQAEFLERKFWSPQARFLAALALTRFREKDLDDIAKLVPAYLYPEHCQVTGVKSKRTKD